MTTLQLIVTIIAAFTAGFYTGIKRIKSSLPPPKPAPEHKYKIVAGNGGFIKLYKDGERIKPSNYELDFEV